MTHDDDLVALRGVLAEVEHAGFWLDAARVGTEQLFAAVAVGAHRAYSFSPSHASVVQVYADSAVLEAPQRAAQC